MKLRRIIFVGLACLLWLVVFVLDVVMKNVDLDIGGLGITRDLLVVIAFGLVYAALELTLRGLEHTPIKKLGLALISATVTLILVLAFAATVQDGFDAKNLSLIPLDYPSQFGATLISLVFGTFALFILRLVGDLVLYKRKRTTLRNFRILLGFLIATAASAITLRPLESGTVTGILFGLTVFFAVMNSFRLSWIVYLSKREKVFALIYTFFLFFVCLALNVVMGQHTTISQSLLYYSYPLREFISLSCIFANLYFGMAFISTLFHLPTADAFDRKTTEISSLHNLGKLVTQVFDFKELVDNVTSMTLQVCEAKSCWLELIHYGEEGEDVTSLARQTNSTQVMSGFHVQVVARKNITEEEIDALLALDSRSLRDAVLESRKPVIVDDVYNDKRFSHLNKKGSVASLAIVPLVSHAGPLGILYVTKDTEFGFFKDDVNVISAFADQATIAIENSRLIKKSIERERLLREMMLAQEMQKKLLPQSLPALESLDIDAHSTPAFEVGGDYYDFLQLDDRRLGVIVGDVSGKGVSAAFYMSEVKGIFQSLSRLYPSPREFMIKANEALATSIDKHSFISLIYAVVDVTSGTLTLSRAGHCPMLHVSGGVSMYLRPSGMGLGLSRDSTFADSMEEQSVTLREGDVCVFYTDGVTEARRGDDEFGYDRLRETVLQASEESATVLKNHVLDTVKAYTEPHSNHDDLTIVVLKWHGNGRGGIRSIQSEEKPR